jgi:hypothetical protein
VTVLKRDELPAVGEEPEADGEQIAAEPAYHEAA